MYAGWEETVEVIVEHCREELGVPEGVAVEAQPHKLLLYEQGGHFGPHRRVERRALLPAAKLCPALHSVV